MRNIAKLVFFFSISFVLLLMFASLFRFLLLWIEAARIMPARPEYSGTLLEALAWGVPFAMYVSVLLSLCYSARKKIPVFPSIFAAFALASAFTIGSSFGIRQAEGVNFALELAPAIGEKPGLILSRNDTAMVLLGAGGLDGPRVMAFPGEELLYQAEPRWPGSEILTPALPFGDKTPWFIQSIIIDFTLSARQLGSRFAESLVSFALYAGALVLLLSSLRFLVGLSVWPLANLFLGAVAFRGILALETFLNAREIQFLISSFLEDRLPSGFVTPAAFAALGIFILIYTFFAELAGGRRASNA